jgi:putative ATP-binding cassette transporter
VILDTQKFSLRTTARRFIQAVRNFVSSEVGWKAKLMLAGLVGLLCAANALNVVNSYVGRNFMSAIAERDKSAFITQALYYVCVFAGLTIVAVFTRFTEERLALLWRAFLTRRSVTLYLANRTYYRLDASAELANPDQRISEDVRSFTVTTLSFVLMALNSTFTVVAFAGVLWSINPLLFIVAVLYAASGSYLTILLGRPLITLNHDQLDKEASFRSALLHVRQNAEAIMLARREGRQTARLLQRLDDLVFNFRRITAVNRNVGFFTTGYNWLIQIIPALIVAPAFLDGKIEFGVITQSAMAFSTLVAAFSLIVTQFQTISSFAAVVARLSSMVQAVERSHAAEGSGIEIVERDGALTYERLTLSSAEDGARLKELSIEIPIGRRVLVTGSNQATGVALFKATAGVAIAGSGRIIRPSAASVVFLSQRPYLPRGTLRQVILPEAHSGEISDDRILPLLRDLGLDQVVALAGGLDAEQDWATSLSLRDQQLLVFAHALLLAPRVVFLDRVGTGLDSGQVRRLLQMLSQNSIGYIANGEDLRSPDLYDAFLEYAGDGSWRWIDRAALPS